MQLSETDGIPLWFEKNKKCGRVVQLCRYLHVGRYVLYNGYSSTLCGYRSHIWLYKSLNYLIVHPLTVLFKNHKFQVDEKTFNYLINCKKRTKRAHTIPVECIF